MKTEILKGVLIACVISLVVSCSPKKEEPAAAVPVIDKEQIKLDIQAREDEFTSMFNSGELKDIGYYADDAVSYSENKPPLVGKSAIIDFYKSNIESKTNSSKLFCTTNEVFVSSDGIQVVEFGSFKVVDSTNTTLNSGNYMSLFEKREGKYVSIRDMSISDMSAN